ncbi:DUF416 family protein [Parashewanella spongiae]|uniref:DUF416 family protein n=1 Tax=Parashewanella spongiae TaxID=342950 RepID=A0A3A6TUT2_9GAMM|nr:YjaG family protein [Parashewanella spongiae]MCL1077806.1 YjaG family protein [Parashewanella spongiae]RJY18018.1 DUF416 family protein [Parashewanella spongiae]
MTKKVGFFKRLKALKIEQKELFAIALCQRMYPNYHLFSTVTEFGNPVVLDTTLNLLWQKQYDKKLKLNTDLYLDKIDSITPEPEDFDMYGVYPALDAAVALTQLLSALQSKVEEDITNVSKLSSSTVANYIEATCDMEFKNETQLDDYIFEHPAMVEERAVQGDLLEIIESNKITSDMVKELRKEIVSSGISNIGISMNE